MTPRHAVFATAIGPCAIAWGGNGIVGAWLPDADEAALRRRIRRRLAASVEDTAPAAIQAVIGRLQALMTGERVDLSRSPLDLDGLPDFHRRTYAIALAIPPGETRSYGEIAQQLGEPGSARAVGQAMGSNPFPPIVPCHRVLAAGGRSGGFSSPGGLDMKRRLLVIERARIGSEPGLFDDL
ncbi:MULTISPECIES: methylated-DNA--[protein]-cysteine S-methyltransferase [unclassified Rhizobacter]|uniref:methylated-DNA--[protein]-cysteine S-methyltransferase n=1 Tax=unclassified Rhizobacter TaxID=2640088 RepID=UPI0006F1DEDB|nr:MULTISPECIES: methylated-DNA--[protein]-cysteine S-methyltransferase [unclassified Rhizobacter]KQU67770.1 cysteine methyltransferase [Rhizobacter sp. Root29]KQW15346.1 cysteine methyltransferase [Rhizobacter sp. Root1238]KRB24490.1 cysteine methyltransferase [Rhizobacter sp. Root16D2]